MNSLKNRLLRLEARNNAHDGGIAELLAMFSELKGRVVLPDELPSGAEVVAIIRSAIGTALRPYSEKK